MRRLRGLTMSELLVVLAVLMILLAILLPLYAKARRSARSEGCLSNMRQIAQAMLVYSGDNDGQMPRSQPGGHWMIDLRLASTFETELRCSEYDAAPGSKASDQLLTGYAQNRCRIYANEVPQPARIVMLAEVADVQVADGYIRHEFVAGPDSVVHRDEGTPVGAWGAERHGGKGHYVMLDGHARLLSPDDVGVPNGAQLCDAGAPSWRGEDRVRFAWAPMDG